MPLILHHQNERSNDDVVCITHGCLYNDETAAQNCSGVTWNNEPAIEWCEEYEPETDNTPLESDRRRSAH